MSKERLRQIKESWEDGYPGEDPFEFNRDFEWLISEVEGLRIYKKSASKEIERLQAENEEVKGKLDFAKGVNQLNFDSNFKSQQKVERLENVLVEISGISDTSPYRESELMRMAAKQALETVGEE